jgi:hypothetical protein
VQVFDAIALQRAEIIGIAEFAAEILEQRPIAVMRIAAVLAPEIIGEIAGDAIVVDEGVVDVEQEGNVGGLGHGVLGNSCAMLTKPCATPSVKLGKENPRAGVRTDAGQTEFAGDATPPVFWSFRRSRGQRGR